ncbi:MAG: hypothetical protein RL407_531 [Bacteroidota bacterium]|jgi:hypothetical protein
MKKLSLFFVLILLLVVGLQLYPIKTTSQGQQASLGLTPVQTPPSTLLEEYTQKYGHFQTKAYENRLFAQPSQAFLIQLDEEAKELQSLYEKLSLEDRRRVKKVVFPFVKINSEGKVLYKKWEDLTEEEKEALNC